jgi:4-hydroxy-2-oxoheptanedioate aldolase
MRTNVVKQRLKQGLPSVGTWLSLSSPYAAEAMSSVGFDWLVIDMEHSPISIETAGLMVSSMFDSNTVPLVRIPWNTGENIKRVLDMGAWGIVVPMVNSREEAEAAVAHAKYFPYGRRSIGGQRHALGFKACSSEYFEKANEEILVVVQIEHIEAVNKIDEILSVPGIDACFIGPNDLMSSMGLKPQLESEDPEVLETIRIIREAAKRHGIASGIHVGSAKTANTCIQEGFQFIAIGSELSYMLTKAQDEISQLVESATGQKLSNQEIRY